MPAVALRCEYEPILYIAIEDTNKRKYNENPEMIRTKRKLYALTRPELTKLATLKENLERVPDEGRGSLGAVHGVGAEGEAGANGLVDVDHCKENCTRKEGRDVSTKLVVACARDKIEVLNALLLILFQLSHERLSEPECPSAEGMTVCSPKRVQHGCLAVG